MQTPCYTKSDWLRLQQTLLMQQEERVLTKEKHFTALLDERNKELEQLRSNIAELQAQNKAIISEKQNMRWVHLSVCTKYVDRLHKCHFGKKRRSLFTSNTLTDSVVQKTFCFFLTSSGHLTTQSNPLTQFLHMNTEHRKRCS